MASLRLCPGPAPACWSRMQMEIEYGSSRSSQKKTALSSGDELEGSGLVGILHLGQPTMMV